MNLFDYYENEADLLEEDMLDFIQLKENFSEILKYSCKTQEEREKFKRILKETEEELKEMEYKWLAIKKAHDISYSRFYTPRNYKYYQNWKNDPFFPWDGKY